MKGTSIFFDVDETLHKGDVFKEYMVFLVGRNGMRLALTFPVLVPALLCYVAFPGERWSLSIILWCLTLFSSEGRLVKDDREFSAAFAARLKPHPEPCAVLAVHLQQGDHVYLVSGSPEPLLKWIYADLLEHPNVTLIGSTFGRSIGGRVLRVRCVLAEKVRQIQCRSGRMVRLKSGYSDSRKDRAVLALCEQKYRVTAAGVIERWPRGSL